MASHFPLFGLSLSEFPIPETTDLERMVAIDSIPCLADASARTQPTGPEISNDHQIAPDQNPTPEPVVAPEASPFPDLSM